MKRDKQVKTMFSKSEMARLESIRVEYDYPNNAEAIRRSVNDEALVMRLSKHPSMLEPFKLLAGSDVKNLTPLEHVLFSNVSGSAILHSFIYLFNKYFFFSFFQGCTHGIRKFPG